MLPSRPLNSFLPALLLSQITAVESDPLPALQLSGELSVHTTKASVVLCAV